MSILSNYPDFNMIDWRIQRLDHSSIFAIGKNLIKPQLMSIMTKIEQRQNEIMISDIDLVRPDLLIYRGYFMRNNSSVLQWICKFQVFKEGSKLRIYEVNENGSQRLIHEIRSSVKSNTTSQWTQEITGDNYYDI